jgi:hypothetical protein
MHHKKVLFRLRRQLENCHWLLDLATRRRPKSQKSRIAVPAPGAKQRVENNQRCLIGGSSGIRIFMYG